MNNMHAVKNKSKNIGEALCTFCKTFISLSDDGNIAKKWKKNRNSEDYCMTVLSCIIPSDDIRPREISEKRCIRTFIKWEGGPTLNLGKSVYINLVAKRMIKKTG